MLDDAWGTVPASPLGETLAAFAVIACGGGGARFKQVRERQTGWTNPPILALVVAH
jgi:hypothetical protein